MLVVHNQYQHRGGEDIVVDSEVSLLRQHGHSVHVYGRHNSELAGISRAVAVRDTFWSVRTEAEVAARLKGSDFEVVHVHNTFPLISPSVYWTAAQANVPVVQSLHNFRLLCPQGMYLRDGNVCEQCAGRLPWRGVVHACYRSSVAQSAVLATMLATHRAMGTWRQKVARYIAFNEFCRRKFVAGGIPEGRLVVKPNFVDVGAGMGSTSEGVDSADRQGGLFVGRLSPEKGIAVLLDALVQSPSVSIDFAGEGPELARVKASPQARALGALRPDAVLRHMRVAAYLVMPSLCYENFPRTLVEAFACGLPVIASRLGAMAELVEDGRTGLLFTAGDARDLAEKLAWAETNPEAMRRMGRAAHAEYLEKYTPDRNYELLMSIYADAIRESARHGP